MGRLSLTKIERGDTYLMKIDRGAIQRVKIGEITEYCYCLILENGTDLWVLKEEVVDDIRKAGDVIIIEKLEEKKNSL